MQQVIDKIYNDPLSKNAEKSTRINRNWNYSWFIDSIKGS